MRDASREHAERGEPIGALEHDLRATQLARERGVLERDAGAGRDGGEELEVLGGEDAEVPVAAESDEPGRSVVQAEGDGDLPGAGAEERRVGGVDRLELAGQNRLAQALEHVDELLGHGRAGLGRRVGEREPSRLLLGQEDVAALDVEDAGQRVPQPLHQLLPIEDVHERRGQLA